MAVIVPYFLCPCLTRKFINRRSTWKFYFWERKSAVCI